MQRKCKESKIIGKSTLDLQMRTRRFEIFFGRNKMKPSKLLDNPTVK